MSYPTTWPAFRAALAAYEPGTDEAAAIFEAQAMGSPVSQAVAVYDALKDADPLDTAGRVLLAGACYMIASDNFHGKGGEAAVSLASVVPTLPGGAE